MATTDLLDLDEARAALRFGNTTTSYDADLAEVYIPAVTAPVEDMIGPVVSRSFTHTADGGHDCVILPHVGVTVTAVTEDGTALTADTQYHYNSGAGIVYRGGDTAPIDFASGHGVVVVTYTAGLAASTAAVDPAIKLAARLILAATWQSDQQGSRPEIGSTTTPGTANTPSGYEIPRLAWNHLARFRYNRPRTV